MEYKIDNNTIKQIIIEDNTEELVKEADKLGKFLAKEARPALSSSQIRMVYGTVKKISLSWTPQSSLEESRASYRQILLLKPKLAYQEGRVSKSQSDAIRAMRNTLEQSIDLINGDVKYFKRFADFFEAILAYHKAYGGK